jgi:hypothetical protein
MAGRRRPDSGRLGVAGEQRTLEGSGVAGGGAWLTWREAYLLRGLWGTPAQQVAWLDGEIARLEAQPSFDPDTSPAAGWVSWARTRAVALRADPAGDPGAVVPAGVA